MDLAKKLNYLDILKEQNDMGLKECTTDLICRTFFKRLNVKFHVYGFAIVIFHYGIIVFLRKN